MATNLPGTTSNTIKFFNGYTNQEININPEVYGQVYAFFEAKTSSKSAAEQLTQNVILLTYDNKLDPLKIINEFNKAASESELKTLLVAFFNSLRPSTSKLGFSSNTNYTNQWIQRNILA
jgi:hypothetical protein